MPTRRKNACSNTALCGLAVALSVSAGCVSLSESMTGISTSHTEAFAAVDGRVLQGKARLTAHRSGSVQLQSVDNPPLSCFGPMSYTSTTQGVISLSCSNGRSVSVSFVTFSPLSGAGRGVMEKVQADTGTGVVAVAGAGAVSTVDFTLTYGLQPDRAATYLAVPLSSLVPLASDKSAMPSAPAPAGP